MFRDDFKEHMQSFAPQTDWKFEKKRFIFGVFVDFSHCILLKRSKNVCIDYYIAQVDIFTHQREEKRRISSSVVAIGIRVDQSN